MLDELQNIDTSAIEDLCTIKAEQQTLSERLQRMEDRRESVSEMVYRRVRGDYEARHGELESQARPLKQRARTEYGKLMALVAAMSGAMESARLAKEELEFRHELGEFTDGDFAARRDAAIEDVGRCERELGEAEQLRARFVEAFHSEDELTAVEPETAATVHDDEEVAAALEETPLVEPAADLEAAAGVPFDEPPHDDEPFPADHVAPPGAGDDDSMATGALPSLTDDLAPENAPVPWEAAGAEPEGGRAAQPPALDDEPLPQAMMDDLPTGRMEVIDPDLAPPPVPGPPLAPEPVGDGGEATAMFSLARLVSPGPDGVEQEVPLNPTETTIGRAPGNHLQINDGAISRQHAKIVSNLDGGYTIYDLGSENGVYVNRERIIDRHLKDGDIIEIGPGTRTFIYRGP